MARIAYKGSDNGVITTNANGFRFYKKESYYGFLGANMSPSRLYGMYCDELAGWSESYQNGYYDNPVYYNSGNYYNGMTTEYVAGSGTRLVAGTKKGSILTITLYTISTSPGTGGTMSGGGEFESGATKTITASPNTGYVVESIDGTYISPIKKGSKTKSITVDSDRTIAATFLPYYTLDFDSNGTGVTGMPSSIEPCLQNETYEIPSSSPVRTGYKFLGWATSQQDADAGTVAYQPGDTFIREAAITAGQTITLYASWAQYTLAYDSAGGSPTPASQTYYGNITLAVAPTKGGLIFDGWLIDGTKYAAGGSYSLEADATAVAQWRGFVLTVTRSAIAGTLSLYDVTAGDTVATESSGTLAYAGEVGHTYRIVCSVGTGDDAYEMPAGISGLTNDAFIPESGETYSFIYDCPFYFVEKAATDGGEYPIAVSSPAAPDTSSNGHDLYAKGRVVEVSADVDDDEIGLSSARLYDTNDSYTGIEFRDITGDKFTIANLGASYYVRGTFATRQYAATATADAASAGAFESLAASPATGPKDTSVTFTATMKSGFSFEGWYLGGERVSTSTTYMTTITADTNLVAKAKVQVTLSAYSGEDAASVSIAVDGEAYSAAFDVVLGESFTVSATVAEGGYWYGWYSSYSTTKVRLPWAQSDTITPTAAVTAIAVAKTTATPSADTPILTRIAYAVMPHVPVAELAGELTIDGEDRREDSTAYGDGNAKIVLGAGAKNGYLFVGWYENEQGEGTPISTDAEFEHSVLEDTVLYARFDPNTHSICEWEGSGEPKPMTWRSKTYEASKPFNPSACRVDALGYPPGAVPGTDIPKVLELTVDMFSAPDSAATATAKLVNIANQDARRLPVRRMERYMQVEVKCNREVDALLVGTSMGGLAQ